LNRRNITGRKVATGEKLFRLSHTLQAKSVATIRNRKFIPAGLNRAGMNWQHIWPDGSTAQKIFLISG
jgi:hypothetical protein